MFITWKYNTMNKSQLRFQNWLRQICNVFVFTFIKHLFKWRDVLHIGCLVEKVINHIVLIWTIKFKGCVRYILASLFYMSKREHLWNKENVFCFTLKARFVLEIFKFKPTFNQVIQISWRHQMPKHETRNTFYRITWEVDAVWYWNSASLSNIYKEHFSLKYSMRMWPEN